MADKAKFLGYAGNLSSILMAQEWQAVGNFVDDLAALRKAGKQLFICGNGGSAANANHLANDFAFAMTRKGAQPIRATALTANVALLTCLGNDTSYAEIFSRQLEIYGSQGDMLLALSGSGNSPNIIRAIETAKLRKMKTYAILGFDGGKCKGIVENPIHFEVNDMQVAEDLQVIVGHMAMQQLGAC